MTCDHLILVLDCSGSMGNQKRDIINGVNEMIKEQRKVEPHRNKDIIFDIIKFNDVVQHFCSKSLTNVDFIGEKDYSPSGSTALFDAIGSTIGRYRDEKDVVMVIATDGQENSSREFSFKEITKLIGDCKENKNWKFIYLSEDIDTFSQGSSLGFNNSSGAYNVRLGEEKIGKTLSNGACNTSIGAVRLGKQADMSTFGTTSGSGNIPIVRPNQPQGIYGNVPIGRSNQPIGRSNHPIGMSNQPKGFGANSTHASNIALGRNATIGNSRFV